MTLVSVDGEVLTPEVLGDEYPPTTARAGGRRPAPSVVGEQGTNAKGDGVMVGTCSAPHCDKSTAGSSGGLCSMHRSRLARHGVLEPQGVGRTHGDPETRFLRFLAFSTSSFAGTPCVEWRGAVSDTGYGSFSGEGRRKTNAHRWAYEHWVGPVPGGFHLDHLCRNTRCVNPAHLEPVTPQENYRRGMAAIMNAERRAATHCKRGHEFSSRNTLVTPRGTRVCRACARIRQQRYVMRRRSDA